MTIDELEEYFKNKELPKTIQLGQAVKIGDVEKFVKSHLEVLKNYNDRQAFKPFYNRLLTLRSLLEEGINA